MSSSFILLSLLAKVSPGGKRRFLPIGLYIAHFDTQKVNIDHQMQSECTGTYFAAST
jgi:hypothetical protein